eukprot:1149834-Pelagomonas_calceolata.AAC.3
MIAREAGCSAGREVGCCFVREVGCRVGLPLQSMLQGVGAREAIQIHLQAPLPATAPLTS